MRFCLLILALVFARFGQAQHAFLTFTENKGQWEEQIAYKANIPAGNLYLENNKLTYLFYSETDMAKIDEIHHGTIKTPSAQDSAIHAHAFEVAFLNAQTPSFQHKGKQPNYDNYFIGNNPEKWANHVYKYEEVNYQNLYKGIDLKFYTQNHTLKYDFVVAPNTDPTQIKLKYTGADSLYFENGHLYIKTSVNTLIEHKPYAYQIINEKEKEVPCYFKLVGDTLQYHFPKKYNPNYELVIDPALIFASYSGATVGNWGFTSTFDTLGHLYGGGVSFGMGYPTTLGAFQTNFNGGVRDASISKFSEDGSTLIYSTYIGGFNTDSPHSLIVDNDNNLVVFGTTNSPDFPAVSSSFCDTLTGQNDIFLIKLDEGGNYIASTFIGGSENDGLNTSTPLKYNYADDYRGEVIVDDNNNIYVASTTISNNFPTTAGVIEPNFISGDHNQNACVFKFTPNLDSLVWSTYFGGNMDDAAYSLQFDELGNILFTGGTKSWDLPVSSNALNTILGGVMDGYIAKINNSATSLQACTYIGTDELDQTFFVQLDTANNVYVIGQTEGTYPIFPSTVYNDSVSGQFIHKLTPDLSSTVFSTTFGSGDGDVDISLSAFLVNECNYILISGWGGTVNSLYSLANSSSTHNLPITSNALQTTTDGSDYYLIMLSENADSLMFATYFGGASSSEHVDGGTSRFDKKGIVYQAVCAGCFGNNDFPTTPGAWSNINGTSLPNVQNQCNLGVFKIDLTRLTANADVYTTPYYCLGDTVHFQNLSVGGIYYNWDFADGNSSNEFEPYHVFDSVGTYHVRLVVFDSVSCILQDTDYVDVFISPLVNASINPVLGVCKGDSVQLEAGGGATYTWTPNYNISDTNVFNPTVWPDSSITYTVIVEDTCGFDTVSVLVNVFQKDIDIDPDPIVCRGDSVQIEAYGGKFYLWSPDSTLTLNNVANPYAFPYNNSTYQVEITDLNNCVWDTFITVFVDTVFAKAVVSSNQTICIGDTVSISVSGGESYYWSPESYVMNPYDSIAYVFPDTTMYFIAAASNDCNTDLDSVLITVLDFDVNIVPDTAICPGEEVDLWAEGGISYWWQPSQYFIDPSLPNQIVQLLNPEYFYVTITDAQGCDKTMYVYIDTLPLPVIELPLNINAHWGDEVVLNATTNGVEYWWSPTENLSCSQCLNPTVTISEASTYQLTVKGENGCLNHSYVTILFDGSLYVPNVFTPNGDGVNDVFYAYGEDIIEFHMQIFNRWGELLFESEDLDKGWDGFYLNQLVKTETYIWKIKFKDIQGTPGELYGTVSVIY